MQKTQWLQQLLRDHEGRLLRFAKRWVSDELARELVQETFLRLWKEDAAALKGREAEWLFCVCRNLAVDHLKKETKMGSDSLEPSELAAGDTPIDEKMAQDESENQVMRMVHALPKSQQEVVRLKFQEGFSYKEISAITGHSVSHVGVLIHEAMKRLKAELALAGSSVVRQGGQR